MAEPDQDDSDSLEVDHEGNYGEDGVRRPMNAFFIFCKRHRDVVREKYPHLENRSITKILGEWWATLDASEKSSYTALAKQYKEAFMKAHPDFKWYKLPTPPTRTLVTRPSNNRCVQSKKDKILPKGSECGIALGKLADEEHLGGLSSLISPSTSESSANSDTVLDVPASSSAPPPASTSNNILKPPKKRYLINGEFKCNSDTLKYDNRDHQTQNACSALLELAEICSSSASRISSPNELSSADNYKSFLDNLSNTTSTNALLCKSALTLHNFVSNSAPQTSKQLAPSCSGIFSISDGYSQQLQDQPLNLCKGKEKTFTARNQTLIDHFVDKFLCDSPATKPSLDTSLSEFTSSKLPNLSKVSVMHHSFTLSDAIESTIDQAYSKDSPSKPTKPELPTESVSVEAKVEESKTEIVFIDKIKKACLASSRKTPEKPTAHHYASFSNPLDDEDKAESSNVKNEKPSEVFPSSSQDDAEKTTNFKREISSSSKYYAKFASPPKKSRVWCNLFMKEQLKDGDVDINLEMATSPVRRNSQRTCKGRRYQALITEGLLQSSKERKVNLGKKPSPTNERIRTRNSTPIETPPVKAKKKKRDFNGKKSSSKEEPESDKNIFDLNEKIASLPKCSLETLNKKKKTDHESSSSGKSSSNNSSVSSTKKSSKSENSNDSSTTDSSKSHQNDPNSSSGRFKSGSFDLEQHIASLPKCDIEVLNKRKSRKD